MKVKIIRNYRDMKILTNGLPTDISAGQELEVTEERAQELLKATVAIIIGSPEGYKDTTHDLQPPLKTSQGFKKYRNNRKK